MLATEFYGCLFVSASPLTAYYQHIRAMFRSDLEITALPHNNMSFSLFNTIDTKTICFLSFASHNPSVILIVYFVNYCKITLH